MQGSRQSLLSREDTLLGVCQAIGDDFGINPLYLRIAFAIPVLWNPAIVFAAYLAVGALVLVSRLVFPRPNCANRTVGTATAVTPLPAGATRKPAHCDTDFAIAA